MRRSLFRLKNERFPQVLRTVMADCQFILGFGCFSGNSDGSHVNSGLYSKSSHVRYVRADGIFRSATYLYVYKLVFSCRCVLITILILHEMAPSLNFLFGRFFFYIYL